MWLVGLVVAAYIWFVAWRVRAERRKKAAEAAAAAPAKAALRSSDLDPPVTSMPAPPPAARRASLPSRRASTAPTSMSPVATQSGQRTVVQALTGIQLPADLVPLTTMAPRVGAGDRVAFWTDAAPVEVVGPAFAAELERLGYEVSARGVDTLVGERDGIHLIVVVHPDALLATIDDKPAFPSVPERAVVVEAWLPE